MIQGISLVILGVIAASSLVYSTHRRAKVILNKIVPLQGWIGLLFCLWGLYNFISRGILETERLAIQPLSWWNLLLLNMMQIAIGGLLCYTMISKFVFSGSKEAKKKGDQRLLELATIQGSLGVAGIAMGAGTVIIFTLC